MTMETEYFVRYTTNDDLETEKPLLDQWGIVLTGTKDAMRLAAVAWLALNSFVAMVRIVEVES
jgi:hypothetical protein